MLVAYLDDSREYPAHDKWSYHAIAGYVAPQKLWNDVFCPRWTQLLASAPHALSEFKASDCRALRGEFKDWKRSEAVEFGRKVVEEIASPLYNEAIGVGAAMLIPAGVDAERRDRFERAGLEYCLADVLGTICLFAQHLRMDADIRFVCDEQPSMQTRMGTLWKSVKDVHQVYYPHHLGDLSFAGSKINAPLQAADVLAYETRKDLKSRREEPPRPMSRALRALLDARAHIAFYLDGVILKQIVDSSKTGQQFDGMPLLFASPHVDWLGGLTKRSLEDPRVKASESVGQQGT